MLPMGTFRDPHPLHTGTGMAVFPFFCDSVERPCGAHSVDTPAKKQSVFHIHETGFILSITEVKETRARVYI